MGTSKIFLRLSPCNGKRGKRSKKWTNFKTLFGTLPGPCGVWDQFPRTGRPKQWNRKKMKRGPNEKGSHLRQNPEKMKTFTSLSFFKILNISQKMF